MLHAHECRIMFFIAVELDAFAVVSVYDEGIANVLLLFLSNGAELFLNVVITLNRTLRRSAVRTLS